MSDTVHYDRAEGGGPDTVYLRMQFEALNRIAAELRGMLAEAPKDDPQVASILRDCDTIEQVASSIRTAIPADALTFSQRGSICANCRIDTGRCPACGTEWKREGGARVGTRPQRGYVAASGEGGAPTERQEGPGA